jgi:hypothetical protein
VKRRNEHIEDVLQKQLKRYLSGEMSDRERYAFEKEAQRDPFLADALDGLETLSTDEFEHDMAELDEMISGRSKRRKWYLITAVAATLLFLVSISVLVNVYRSNEAERMRGVVMLEDTIAAKLQNRERSMAAFSEDTLVSEESSSQEINEESTAEDERKPVQNKNNKKNEVYLIVSDDHELSENEEDASEAETKNIERSGVVNEAEVVSPAPVAAAARSVYPVQSTRQEQNPGVVEAGREAETRSQIDDYKKRLEKIILDSIPGIKKLKIELEIISQPGGEVQRVVVLKISEKKYRDKIEELIKKVPVPGHK